MMAAHIRQIVFECEAAGCAKKFTHQVHNTRNAPMGRYCEPHAKRELKAFLAKYPEER